jgi:capsular exopolysaccharide synthesis family protein
MIPESAFPGHPPSVAARESFQTLRASLRYFNLDRSLSIVLVTSPAHADGKTTVSTNLALAMARDGADVVLLDADLRRPQAARRLGLDGSYGLESIIVDKVPISDALQEVDAGGGSLNVIASIDPSPSPAPLLSSGRMRELLAELAERHDTVVIDTPPILAVADAVPLLSVASGVVLVSRVNQTGLDAILRTSRIIESADGRLLGNVPTGVHDGGGLYGYGSYGYGYEHAAPTSSE